MTAKSYALTALFCIFIAIFCLAIFAATTIGESLRPQAFAGILQDVDLHNLQVGDILNQPENITLSEFLYNELQDTYLHQNIVNPSSINNLLTHIPIAEFTESILGRYASAISYGINTSITATEIINFIRENEHIIYRETGFQLQPADYQGIEDFLHDMEIGEITRLDTMLGNVDISIPAISNIYTPIVIVLLGGIKLLSVGIFFALKRQLRKTLMCDAATICISGIIFAVLSRFVGNIVASFIPSAIDQTIIDALLSGVRSTGMTVGIVAAVIGIVAIFVLTAIDVIQKSSW